MDAQGLAVLTVTLIITVVAAGAYALRRKGHSLELVAFFFLYRLRAAFSQVEKLLSS